MNQIRPVGAGVGLAITTLVFTFLLPKDWAVEFMALLLAVIAAIYVGFALADGEKKAVYLEIGTAIFFVIIALIGLWVSPWVLVVGYLGHGVWDWLHHRYSMKLHVVSWYPPFCAVYDVLVGLGFILLLL